MLARVCCFHKCPFSGGQASEGCVQHAMYVRQADAFPDKRETISWVEIESGMAFLRLEN